MLTADFDGDGDLDVALLDRSMERVALHYNRGDGVFLSSQLIAIGSQSTTIANGDLDGDGDEDLYVVYEWGSIRRIRNDGGGQFVLEAWHAGPDGGRTLTAAAIDGDGDKDLVGTVPSSESVAVHRNLGSGTLAPAELVEVGAGTSDPFVLVDIDRDGDLDLLAPTFGGAAVVVTNRGDGTFDRPASYTAGASITAAVGADFDADGDIDVIAGSFVGDVLTLVRNLCR